MSARGDIMRATIAKLALVIPTVIVSDLEAIGWL